MTQHIELKQVYKAFGSTKVLQDFNLSFEKGKFTTLLGASGCGKTTILRLIAGLEDLDQGQILCDGEDISRLPPQQRGVGIVFQSYALFPHLTVGENVAFGLKMKESHSSDIAEKVSQALKMVELKGFEHRRIEQLSGGQQQRVALARALVIAPQILLFDEPLSNLDTNLRRTMREMIRHLQQKLGITVLYVTHDQTEAFAVTVKNGKYVLAENSLSIESNELPQDGNYLLGIRPEGVLLELTGKPAERCDVQSAMSMGNYWEIQVRWHGLPLLVHLNPNDYTPNQPEYFVKLRPIGWFVLAEENF